MIKTIKRYWVGLIAVMGLAPLGVQAAEDKPNFIYLLSDELAYFDPGFMGNQELKTPNLDRMAEDGIIFRNMLSGASNCAPSRGSLMTGKHTGKSSVRVNRGHIPLRADEDTIASLLKAQGYAVGGFGKWGMGARGSTGVPENHGFDVFFGYYDQVHAHTYYPPYLIRNSEEVPLEGNYGLRRPGETYSHYVIHDAALEWIRENADEPFFAYLPYTAPHGPFVIPDDDPALEFYKDKPWPDRKIRYAAMVTMLDRGIGEIRALLEELGIEENTLVFISGDNGKISPAGGNTNPKTGEVQFRGDKGTLYEGGLRVPCIAFWPGKIAPGRVTEHLGYFPDILPTFAELAGAEIPNDVNGISLVPELLGEEVAGYGQPEHEYLFWLRDSSRAIRSGDWRLVRPGGSDTWELYNVDRDSAETNDLASEHPDIVERLAALAEQAVTPVRTGSFHTEKYIERDRRAKWARHDEE